MTEILAGYPSSSSFAFLKTNFLCCSHCHWKHLWLVQPNRGTWYRLNTISCNVTSLLIFTYSWLQKTHPRPATAQGTSLHTSTC